MHQPPKLTVINF